MHKIFLPDQSVITGAACLSVAILAVGCIPFGDAWFSFSGDVRDAAGRPVPGAELSILVNGESKDSNPVAVADERGHYEVFESSCPCKFDFELVVSADGFCDYQLQLPGRRANRLDILDITMETAGYCDATQNQQ